MDLYLITDRKIFHSEVEFYNAIESALKGGLKMLQMREKDLPDRMLLEMAYRLRDITTKYSAKLFINNRVDIAMIVSADGVHIGQGSICADVVRRICRENMLIGVSTHSLGEAIDAQQMSADFVTFGPIFETPSKKVYGQPVGLENLKVVIESIKIPVYAIGGIKLDNLAEVMKCRPKGIALISGILASRDIYDTTRRYLDILGEIR